MKRKDDKLRPHLRLTDPLSCPDTRLMRYIENMEVEKDKKKSPNIQRAYQESYHNFAWSLNKALWSLLPAKLQQGLKNFNLSRSLNTKVGKVFCLLLSSHRCYKVSLISVVVAESGQRSVGGYSSVHSTWRASSRQQIFSLSFQKGKCDGGGTRSLEIKIFFFF